MLHDQGTLKGVVGVLYDLKACGHIYDYYHAIRRGGCLAFSLVITETNREILETNREILETNREILETNREILEIDREMLEISCERPLFVQHPYMVVQWLHNQLETTYDFHTRRWSWGIYLQADDSSETNYD